MEELSYIKTQENILTSYIASTERAIENNQSFINAVDLEIMKLAQDTIYYTKETSSALYRASNILEERKEQDTIVTQRHIEVCKAIKLVAVFKIINALKSNDVSFATGYEEQTSEIFSVE